MSLFSTWRWNLGKTTLFSTCTYTCFCVMVQLVDWHEESLVLLHNTIFMYYEWELELNGRVLDHTVHCGLGVGPGIHEHTEEEKKKVQSHIMTWQGSLSGRIEGNPKKKPFSVFIFVSNLFLMMVFWCDHTTNGFSSRTDSTFS